MRQPENVVILVWRSGHPGRRTRVLVAVLREGYVAGDHDALGYLSVAKRVALVPLQQQNHNPEDIRSR